MSSFPLTQRLVAILAADIVGFSRLMASDAPATVHRLDVNRAVFQKHIAAHGGRVIDMVGDSVLAVFDATGGAINAALEIQREISASLDSDADTDQMQYRIGVHLGDVYEKSDGTVYGDGVNMAARLEGLAPPGGVAASDSVRLAVKGKAKATFEDRGHLPVKNMAEPVHTFYVSRLSSDESDRTTVNNERSTVSALQKPVPGFGGRPAIAILPFDNLSSDPDQEYFADGLAEDIRNRLAMWRWVPVIAGQSCAAFKGRATDVKRIGQELGARYAVEGSVRHAAQRVRVTAQLIDTDSGYQVWNERYDRALSDLFALQDQLTDGIAGALEGAIGRAEIERARMPVPGRLDAWQACQRGLWHLYRMTAEDFGLALAALDDAIDLDSQLAQAHWGKSLMYLLQAFFLWSEPGPAVVRAGECARDALACDPLDAGAHSVLAAVDSFSGNLDEALYTGLKGVELNPSSAFGHHITGTIQMFRGEVPDGIESVETAIRISPNDALMHVWLSSLSSLHYLNHDYNAAATSARLATRLAPDYPIAWRSLANALGQLGDAESAQQALTHFLDLMPGYVDETVARASVGFQDEELFQHYLDGLRKSGWSG